jgi:hypothetical protein
MILDFSLVFTENRMPRYTYLCEYRMFIKSETRHYLGGKEKDRVGLIKSLIYARA